MDIPIEAVDTHREKPIRPGYLDEKFKMSTTPTEPTKHIINGNGTTTNGDIIEKQQNGLSLKGLTISQ